MSEYNDLEKIKSLSDEELRILCYDDAPQVYNHLNNNSDKRQLLGWLTGKEALLPRSEAKATQPRPGRQTRQSWLMEHIKWVFSGIGVALITAAISYFSTPGNTVNQQGAEQPIAVGNVQGDFIVNVQATPEPRATPSPTFTPTPVIMSDDVFGIAIAPLMALDLEGRPVQPDFAHDISGNIARYINEQRDELQNILEQSVEVWGPDLASQTVTDHTASEVAKSLNTDLLIYGTLRQIAQDQWVLEPAFYIAETSVQKSIDLGGEYPLGEEIIYRADRTGSLRDINTNLRSRLSILTQIILGVSYLSYDDHEGYQQAARVLQEALSTLEETEVGDNNGQEVLNHFLGVAYLLWATLLDDDSVERDELLENARSAYEQALSANPQFVRANNGLGSTLFQLSRPLVGKTKQEDSCNWKWDEFDAALENYQLALNADPQEKPPSGYVDFYGHFGLGRIYFWQGACRHNGSIDPELSDWEAAQQQYQAVLDEFTNLNEPLPVLQNIAAYANADMGQIALVKWDLLTQTGQSSPEELAQLLSYSRDYLVRAVDLDLASGTEPGRKHAIATMPNYLTTLCLQGETDQVEATLTTFLEKVQRFEDVEKISESIRTHVLPAWEACTDENIEQ